MILNLGEDRCWMGWMGIMETRGQPIQPTTQTPNMGFLIFPDHRRVRSLGACCVCYDQVPCGERDMPSRAK